MCVVSVRLRPFVSVRGCRCRPILSRAAHGPPVFVANQLGTQRMQWIFMLAGLVLGALADESLSAGLLGGLIGLALGETLRLQGLELQNSELRKELLAFAARFEQGGVALQERLRPLEAGQTPTTEAAEPVPAASAEPIETAAAPAD